MNPKLRCAESELSFFAARYQYPLQDTKILNLRPSIAKRGWLIKDEQELLQNGKPLEVRGIWRITQRNMSKNYGICSWSFN
jgi:hypothetical protein